ncbi:MAG: lipoprotein signal peptidase [Chitinophagaceae bacterium]
MVSENFNGKTPGGFRAKHAVLLILGILLLDQALKIYIKTHFTYGEERLVLGSWLRLHFIENEGMAWGLKFKIDAGKLFLTLFRLVAVIWGTFFILKLIRKKYPAKLLTCCCLIYAGAAGNLIDSMFYGVIFDKGAMFNANGTDLNNYEGLAQFTTHGYTSFMNGNVVDMIYCPLFSGHFPSWMPFVGGDYFEFFNLIFNLADAAICIGLAGLLLLRKRKPEVIEDLP